MSECSKDDNRADIGLALFAAFLGCIALALSILFSVGAGYILVVILFLSSAAIFVNRGKEFNSSNRNLESKLKHVPTGLLKTCPRCNCELDKGYLADTSNIIWHPETESKWRRHLTLNRLCRDHDGKRRMVEAELCRNCGLVLFTGKRVLEGNVRLE